MTSLRYSRSVQKASETRLPQDAAQAPHRVKFLVDHTTSPFMRTIEAAHYDVAVVEDQHTAPAAVLRAAKDDGRTLLTLNEEFAADKDANGVIILPPQFKEDSPANKTALDQLLKAAEESIDNVRLFPIGTWRACKNDSNLWTVEKAN